MSRVVVISQLPPPIHGSTVMTKTFLQTLDKLGHDWRLVDRRFSTSVAEVGKFSLRKLASAAWMPFRLLHTMASFKPDVVVLFATNRTLSFIVDWALSEVLRWFPARRINYLHTIGFKCLADRGRAFGWLVARLLGSAETTVCLGPTCAKDLTGWVDESRIVFIPNTVVDHPNALTERDPDASPLVLYLSNLIPEKGAETFVDLAIELAPALPDATFVVAGATADRTFTDTLLAKVTTAGLSSHVQFAGAITDQRKKWRLLSDASVLVFPSTYKYEAQPLTILEALSVGTPVVAYDVGGIRDVLRDGADGRLLPIGDMLGMLKAVRSLARAAARTPDSRFTADSFSLNWESALNGHAILNHEEPA